MLHRPGSGPGAAAAARGRGGRRDRPAVITLDIMRTRAAVVRETGQPWEVTELELDEPRDGEVRIRFAASGMCHSDEHLRTGDAAARLPMVGGHEGAGVVEAAG